jgi:hypothetical protein
MFNKLYSKVKAYMSAQNKRKQKDAEPIRHAKKHQFSEASGDKKDADVEGQASSASMHTTSAIAACANFPPVPTLCRW